MENIIGKRIGLYDVLYECGHRANDGHKLYRVKCSECGFDDGFVFYNYCPNCGARMEPEDEDKSGKLINASDAAEALREKLNIPMADLVDLFAEIPGIPRRRIT